MNVELAIAMITTPRVGVKVNDTINHLRVRGFIEPIHLFCEPNTEIPDDNNTVIHQNETQLGGANNLQQARRFLITQPQTHLLMLEDDIEFSVSARKKLEEALDLYENYGFIQMYTTNRLRFYYQGWFPFNNGYAAEGNLAICYNKIHLERYLEANPVPKEPTDGLLHKWYHEKGIPVIYHNPSLTQHLGRVSTMKHADGFGLNYNPNF